MENFLNISWQEEVVNKQNAILRGARGSGKTIVAVRWAIENMKRGHDVTFLSGLGGMSSWTIQEMFVKELTRQGIEILARAHGLISLGNRTNLFLHTEGSSIFRHSGRVWQRAIVIDDADYLSVEKFKQLQINPEASLFITGTHELETMDIFLKPHWHPLYCEFNYNHMLEAGLLSKIEVTNWARLYMNPEQLKNEFGPWREIGNRSQKHVLDKYDN